MRRDMDLIRLLLLHIEGEEDVDFIGYSEEQVRYHQYLLIDSGLVIGDTNWVNGVDGKPKILSVWVSRMTSEGHDFLDAARNESVWKKTVSKVHNSGGGVTIDIMKALLIATLKEKLGL